MGGVCMFAGVFSKTEVQIGTIRMPTNTVSVVQHWICVVENELISK